MHAIDPEGTSEGRRLAEWCPKEMRERDVTSRETDVIFEFLSLCPSAVHLCSDSSEESLFKRSVHVSSERCETCYNHIHSTMCSVSLCVWRLMEDASVNNGHPSVVTMGGGRVV